MKRILLICTGNTCRSPMAVFLFREHLADRGAAGSEEFEFISAGLSAQPGFPLNERARAALKSEGIEPDEHESRQLRADMVEKADLILSMTSEQAGELERRFPRAAERIYTLAGFAGLEEEIPDPFGGSQRIYDRTLSRLDAIIEKAVESLEIYFVEMKRATADGSDNMKIALGSDHAGYSLKEELKGWLEEEGYETVDMGTDSEESVDYPDFAGSVARAVSDDRADLGLLVCGTGLGMSMTANKFSGIRAARCQDAYSARMARRHNDANILTLGERVVGAGLARDVLRTFLETEFAGGRHQRRVDKICEQKGVEK